MKATIYLALAIVSATDTKAQADDSSLDFSGSVNSQEFTEVEKKYFTNATDRFVKYELRHKFNSKSVVAWLDNDHIVLSARSLPGWEAENLEPSKIISLNVTTGEYVDSGYRGNLICLNHLSNMMVRLGGDDTIHSQSNLKYEWLIGKWGEKLTPIQRPENPVIPSYLCQFYPFGDAIHAIRPEKITDDTHRNIPLLPEHGYLRATVRYPNGHLTEYVYHVKPDGNTNLISHQIPLLSTFRFHPWMDAYFEQVSLRHKPRKFNPSKGFSDQPIPTLLAYWTKYDESMSVGGTLTKSGMLWDVHQGYGYWKKQGLYLDTPEGLLRIDEGRGEQARVSPNGCRILDTVSRGNPYGKLPRNNTFLVIDVCKVKND